MLVVITTHHLKSRHLIRLITSRLDSLFEKASNCWLFFDQKFYDHRLGYALGHFFQRDYAGTLVSVSTQLSP